jgi:hypothetical protein
MLFLREQDLPTRGGHAGLAGLKLPGTVCATGGLHRKAGSEKELASAW